MWKKHAGFECKHVKTYICSDMKYAESAWRELSLGVFKKTVF